MCYHGLLKLKRVSDRTGSCQVSAMDTSPILHQHIECDFEQVKLNGSMLILTQKLGTKFTFSMVSKLSKYSCEVVGSKQAQADDKEVRSQTDTMS